MIYPFNHWEKRTNTQRISPTFIESSPTFNDYCTGVQREFQLVSTTVYQIPTRMLRLITLLLVFLTRKQSICLGEHKHAKCTVKLDLSICYSSEPRPINSTEAPTPCRNNSLCTKSYNITYLELKPYRLVIYHVFYVLILEYCSVHFVSKYIIL